MVNLAIFLPFVLAIVVGLMPNSSGKATSFVATLGSLITLALGVVMAMGSGASPGRPQLTRARSSSSARAPRRTRIAADGGAPVCSIRRSIPVSVAVASSAAWPPGASSPSRPDRSGAIRRSSAATSSRQCSISAMAWFNCN